MPGMSDAQTFYEGHAFYEGLTWWSVRERIGRDLREIARTDQKVRGNRKQIAPRSHVNRNPGRNRRQLLEALRATS